MPPKTTRSSTELGALLRARREELGLTIEDAARAARLGSETWRRYEGGSSIRRDKVRGVLHALRWTKLPTVGTGSDPKEPTGAVDEHWFDNNQVEEFGDSYSHWLAESIDDRCARTFAVGLDLLLDQAGDDLEELASRPRGTHLGELGASWIIDGLPARWIPRYDYDFVFRLRATAENVKLRLDFPGMDSSRQIARSVIDKLTIHLIFRGGMTAAEAAGSDVADEWEDWVLTLTDDDDDFVYLLFSDKIIWGEESEYHFDHWFDTSLETQVADGASV